MAEIFAFDYDEEEVTIISDDSCSDYVEIIENDENEVQFLGSTSDDFSIQQIIDISEDSLSNNSEQQKISRQDFEFCTVIGKGAYGKVYLARKKTGNDCGTICAMKVLKKGTIIKKAKDIENTKAERHILETIKHPFIVKLLYAFQTDGRLYLGLEYMCGGELFSYLDKENKFSEDTARFYISEVLLAVEHLHSHGIAYRDLKPENVLLDSEGHIKLTDFGLSKELVRENITYTFCGTIDYMAPEIIANYGHNRAVDWWSFGVMLYDMLTGNPPFKVNNRKEAMEQVLTLKVKFEPYVTTTARDLIRKLLTHVRRRLGYRNGASDIKKHKFFANINWDDVLLRKLEPPFKPIVRGINDVSNFDRKFTSLAPQESPDDFSLSESAKHLFNNFSYTAQNDKIVTHPNDCR